MLTYPNIRPVAIALGPLQVHWYGLMYLLAFLFAWDLQATARKERTCWTPDMVSDLIFYGALGVVIGGRVGYVFFYGFEQFLANPIWLFQVWTGGMSFPRRLLGCNACHAVLVQEIQNDLVPNPRLYCAMCPYRAHVWSYW